MSLGLSVGQIVPMVTGIDLLVLGLDVYGLAGTSAKVYPEVSLAGVFSLTSKN